MENPNDFPKIVFIEIEISYLQTLSLSCININSRKYNLLQDRIIKLKKELKQFTTQK